MGLLWYSPIWDTCRRPGTIWPKLRIHGIHGNGGFLRQPGIFLWDFQGSPTEPLRAMGTTTHDNFYHRMANPSYAWWHCMNKSHEVTCSHSEVFHLLQLLTAFSHLLILLQLPLHLVLSRLVEVSHHHLQKFSGICFYMSNHFFIQLFTQKWQITSSRIHGSLGSLPTHGSLIRK